VAKRKGRLETNGAGGSQSNPEDVPLVFGPVIVIDTREQLPFDFHGLRADARDQCRPLLVTTERGTLKQGDYSLKGHERAIALERKSLADLFSTIGQERDRFVRELERLDALEVAAVVIEASWEQILRSKADLTFWVTGLAV
jgi:ERCC4-type nuclease